MKTINPIVLTAALAAAFTLSPGVRGADSARSARGSINHALASSPRFLEEHPALLRIPQSAGELETRAARIRTQQAKLAENRALASSPRFLELHPEIVRPPPSLEEAQARADRAKKQLARLMANHAWAASPRVREEYPAISRGMTWATANGGTSKRMESGK